MYKKKKKQIDLAKSLKEYLKIIFCFENIYLANYDIKTY